MIVLCPGTRLSNASPIQSHVSSTVLTQACDNNVIAMCLLRVYAIILSS